MPPTAPGELIDAGTPATPDAAAELIESGTPATPVAAGDLVAGPPGALLAFEYEMPGDFPAGTFTLIGTTAELGAVWVAEPDLGSVTITGGGSLAGAGSVWVQRYGGTFAWSLEYSSNWASVSPTVYLQQTSGGATRGEFPTPAAVATGGWLDVINDIDPDDEGMVLELDGVAAAAAAASLVDGTPQTPAAPGSIV